MPRPVPEHLAVAVAGGSIGGLCAGNALLRAGFDVHVFERSAHRLPSRGAGIVVQPELLDLIAAVDAEPLATTGCSIRRTVVAATGQVETTRMPQRFTSWEAIHASLRSGFPDDRHHSGCELTLEAQSADGVSIGVGGERIDADLLIAADGIRSRFRERLAPDTMTRYAGYVAWRGVVDEAALEPELVDHFDDTFSFCQTTGGGHALCYFIPGSGLATGRGGRRLNWVWYIHVDAGPVLDTLMTDRSGRRRDASVPQGEISDEARDFLFARTGTLSEPFARLVQATPDPFIQSIIDVVPPAMAFGRVGLIGDAAFVVRPHTAAAAAKAAADSMALAQALRGADDDFSRGLAVWERRQMAVGRQLVDYGVMLGERSQRR
ncbi:FAD-dependent monooxygenase [Eilatimonas milleporae]|uniref:2-polyprenyl-6-methoxyphenol hydroxylase-like FAD-dependent oxidoreductase n=1 Tax=Eilatimonas milleporae TaxID=911205 RepID=A0A3M0C215_9PROT|nr:FAD-dependent monooxygenase [Eilatimonas milleporae]RMB02925.1 2-polyprenyl-6-methoxyphenol hydroxylase-like FAD-dependent oxidoreductase [Eilatimonas milleporae]